MNQHRIESILRHLDPETFATISNLSGLSSFITPSPTVSENVKIIMKEGMRGEKKVKKDEDAMFSTSESSSSDDDTDSVSSDDTFNTYEEVSKITKSLYDFKKTLFPPAYFEAREKTLALIRENPDVYYIDNQWSPRQRKEVTQKQFQHFAKSGLLTVEIVNSNLFWFLGVTDAMCTFDISLLAKIVIHYQLFGSCLWRVGTEKHRKILKDVDNGSHCCSFSMTEVAHGSNVRALETEAIYDPKTQEFEIHTPKNSAVKMWIGNTAFYGTLTIVFAQLILNGERKGVHAFLVPLRDPKTMEVKPGITIKDLGVKNAWQGVDNSLIRFNRVRVPRENLLDRFAAVLPDGTYSSSIRTEGERFAKTLAALLFGRVLYIVGPTMALQNSLTIAIRYACQRRQFGDSRGEQFIWDYPVHRTKLTPPLAYSWAFQLIVSNLCEQFATLTDETLHDFHTLISSVKAYICEYTPIQLAKNGNTCGGHGVMRDTRLGELQADMFPFQIAEGDSTVLYQQTARDLMDRLKRGKVTGVSGVNRIVSSIVAEYGESINLRNGLEDKALGTATIISSVAKYLEILMLQAMKQIASEQQKGYSATDAWNCAQVTLITASRVFVELHLLLNFASYLRKPLKSAVKSKLLHLFNLFALEVLSTHLGPLLAEGVLSSEVGRTISTLRTKLATAFNREEILAFVNGFMIPDDLLRAAIGKSDLNYIVNILNLVGMPTIEEKIGHEED